LDRRGGDGRRDVGDAVASARSFPVAAGGDTKV